MVELATRGAGVLHPRSVELARQFNVPLVVKNSMIAGEAPGSETRIVERKAKGSMLEKGMEEFQIVGVTSDPAKVWLKVQLSRPTVLSALWAEAAREHLQVVASQFSEGQVRAFIERESISDWKKLLSKLASQGFVVAFEVCDEWVPVSVVGDRLSQDGAALQQVCETLAGAGIDVGTGSGSAIAITVAVPRARVDEAVSALHRVFLER
jgi:aspartate kinase